MEIVVKRLRINTDTIDFYRKYYSHISFQRFINNCIDNEKNRKLKRKFKNL